MTTLKEIENVYRQNIEDIETVRTIIEHIQRMPDDRLGDLYDYNGNDLVLINPRTKSIIEDAVKAIEERFVASFTEE